MKNLKGKFELAPAPGIHVESRPSLSQWNWSREAGSDVRQSLEIHMEANVKATCELT